MGGAIYCIYYSIFMPIVDRVSSLLSIRIKIISGFRLHGNFIYRKIFIFCPFWARLFFGRTFSHKNTFKTKIRRPDTYFAHKKGIIFLEHFLTSKEVSHKNPHEKDSPRPGCLFLVNKSVYLFIQDKRVSPGRNHFPGLIRWLSEDYTTEKCSLTKRDLNNIIPSKTT